VDSNDEKYFWHHICNVMKYLANVKNDISGKLDNEMKAFLFLIMKHIY
jgi:hypothetical protein